MGGGGSGPVLGPRLVRVISRRREASTASSKNISKKSPMRKKTMASGYACLTSKYCRNIGVEAAASAGEMAGAGSLTARSVARLASRCRGVASRDRLPLSGFKSTSSSL